MFCALTRIGTRNVILYNMLTLIYVTYHTTPYTITFEHF